MRLGEIRDVGVDFIARNVARFFLPEGEIILQL